MKFTAFGEVFLTRTKRATNGRPYRTIVLILILQIVNLRKVRANVRPVSERKL